MDGRGFDDLARVVATGFGSRRRGLWVLAGLAGGVLGGAEVAAGCTKVGKKCDKSRDCCKRARCKGKRCRCKRGWADCKHNGRCNTNLRTDPDHCGACDDPCPSGQVCCAGACADLATDGANCGTCGNACPSGACTNGTCLCETGDQCLPPCNTCADRLGGGKACSAGGNTGQPCDEDADCPFGTFCTVTMGGLCSTPCDE